MQPNKFLAFLAVAGVLALIGGGMVYMASRMTQESSGFENSVQNLTTTDSQPTFRKNQMQNGSVQLAVESRESFLKQLFSEKGLEYPPKQIFLRAFNDENAIEMWVSKAGDERFETLLKTYPLCFSADLSKERGPAYPEGLYRIERFYPKDMRFGLALGVNYPNLVDTGLLKKKKRREPLYIRGGCDNTGSFHAGYEGMQEIYLLAMEAHIAGQKEIPFHVYPARMNAEGMKGLKPRSSGQRKVYESLKQSFEEFEATKALRKYSMDPTAGYVFEERAAEGE